MAAKELRLAITAYNRVGFYPRKSAFKTGVTPPTALSVSNLSSLPLPETPDLKTRISVAHLLTTGSP
jgi:hypothetical protein